MEHALRRARRLSSLLRENDRVLLVIGDTDWLDWFETLLALQMLGAIPVLLTSQQYPKEIADICARVRPTLAIVYDATVLDQIDVPSVTIQQTTQLEEGGFVSRLSDDDVAMIIPSSGTTGEPKLVEVPHSIGMATLNLESSPGCVVQVMSIRDVFCSCFEMLRDGTKHVFLNTGSPLEILAVVQDVKPMRLVMSCVLATAWTWGGFLGTEGIDQLVIGYDTPSLEVFRALADRFPGAQICCNYSAAEVLPARLWTLYDRTQDRLLGYWPDLWTEARISPAGRPVPDGVGEIQVRCLAGKGHREFDVSLQSVAEEGWTSPGDLGSVEANGMISILGRRTDRIVRGMKSLYPAAFERTLKKDTAVKDVCVVGMPDDVLGEKVVAVVEQHEKVDPDLARDELMRAWEGLLDSSALPDDVVIVDHLPRLPNGRILRAALRANLAKHS